MKNKDNFSSFCNNHHRKSNNRFCNFCKRFGHNIETCYQRNKSAVLFSAATVATTESVQPMAPVTAQSQSSGSTFTISRDDLINIIANVIRMVGNASYSSSLSALSCMSPSSWLMDSSCYNHMTPHSSLFSELQPAPHPLNIRTANGSTMSGHNIGSVSTSNLSVPAVFYVPDLSYNLFSVGQLAELGYRIIFDYSGCIVQDLRTGQELGTGPRVGRIFPVDNLHLPLVAPISVATAAAVSSIPSLELWHARLGHTSSSRTLQLMASMLENEDKLKGQLYNAIQEEDVEKVIELCGRFADHAMHRLTIHEDTVLHVATYSKQTGLVLRLLEALPPQHIHKITTSRNVSGNTILHEVATLDDSSEEVATNILERAPELLSMRNELGESVLFQSARYGKIKIFNFLADKISKYDEDTVKSLIQRNDKTTILHIAILAHQFGLALNIARRFRHIIGEKDQDEMTALQLLSCNPSAFKPVRRRGSHVRNFSNVPESHEFALDLAKLLVEEDTSWKCTSSNMDLSRPKPHNYGSCSTRSNASSADEKKAKDGSSNVNPSMSKLPKYGSCSGVLSTNETGGSSRQPLKQGGVTPLFLATKSGCVEIVKEILKIYPQAVEHIDDEGQCILHVAIKYRQLEVFKHVSEIKVPMRWLVRRLDNNGNTILHMVGMPIHDYVPEKMLGPALQLQQELLWFERVKSVTKEAFVCHQNDMRETAEGLFATSKSVLRNSARDWLIRTSEGCTIVAVLIATVAFAAAYTIPGGSDQETGLPVLLNHPFFVVSTATDVLSLACALTSVVMFLSILTAPFRLEDFKHSLPNKLMLGFTFLFFSVVMMMISFSATIILIIRGKERWTKILLYSLSFLLVGIFALAYFPLFLSLTKTHKHLLKKIKEAFPCCCWFPTVSRVTYFFHSNRAEIRHSSIRLQGGSNNNSSRDNPEGKHFGSQDTSQTKQFAV